VHDLAPAGDTLLPARSQKVHVICVVAVLKPTSEETGSPIVLSISEV
jgi:hypothetical protein